MGISANGKKFMDNSYNYDAIGNILGISNSATPDGDIGGATSHTYSYDELNRLVQAQGSYTGSKSSSNYTLSMQYDIMGNIMRKTQNHVTDGTQQMGTSHDLVYKYEGTKPNAASKIGECLYTYDENGNLTFREDTVTNNYRQLWWDEENRLMMLSDDGYVNNYLYDASGERVVKSHGGSQGVYINGAPIGVINHSEANYTVYVSPYFTMDANKFTKHYYAGSTRVSSKIGNGRFENQFRSGVFEITAGSVNYIARQQNLKQGYQNYIQNLGIPPGPPTMKGINGDPYNSGKAINPVNDVNTKVPSGWPGEIIFAPPGGPPGAPIQYGDSITNNTVEPGFGYIGTGSVEENLRYFFHSDHLGSTSYITNAKGEITQFVGYMPFGECFVEQHTDFDSPFKFNGKEMDSETGLISYGARYLDPKIGRWLSIDPMIEEHPDYTAYAYCYNNPINLIDPFGLDTIKIHVLANKNKELTGNINEAVKQMNATYKELNVDLNVSWSYIKSKKEIMSKDAFYKRKGAKEHDSYVVMAYAGNVEGVAKDMNNKGWGKIDVTTGTNGTSAEKDFAAIINLSNALVPENGINTYGEINKFDSPAQKLSMTVQHETGHPKFISHSRSENYDHINKKPSKVPSHVPFTIMSSNFIKSSKHDPEMKNMLIRLHGKRK
jgi:RHS repeat-associated protein